MNLEKNNKVNLFILGEQKCSTSSLHTLIVKNTKVLAGYRKECQYFSSIKFKEDINYNLYHQMYEPKWYKNYKYLIDSTPDYFSNDTICNRIFEYNAHSKFIILLRNPLERMISAYNFYFSNILGNIEVIYQDYFKNSEQGELIYQFLLANKNATFQEVLTKELEGSSPLKLIERSLYGKHLEQWYSKFSPEQIQILWFENLINPSTQKIEIDELKEFLGIDLSYDFPLRNKTIDKKSVTFQFDENIIQLIKTDQLLLEKLTKKKIPYVI